jgi:pilus assembly protein CpaB
MKRLPAIVGVVAIALFLVTVSYVNSYMKSLKRGPAPVATAPDVASVVVAAQEIPLGTKLSAEHLRTVAWPKDALPPGATGDPAALVGSLTISRVAVNEPLLSSKLAGDDGGALMAFRIPSGKRAVSVRVNDVTGISGFVTPGTHVDLIAVMDTPNVEGGRGAFTLLENIEVLAIAQQMDERETGPVVVNTVTLLVTPSQAERLALASQGATLQLALRSYKDGWATGATGVSITQIAFSRSGPSHTVELIRGQQRIAHSF